MQSSQTSLDGLGYGGYLETAENYALLWRIYKTAQARMKEHGYTAIPYEMWLGRCYRQIGYVSVIWDMAHIPSQECRTDYGVGIPVCSYYKREIQFSGGSSNIRKFKNRKSRI